MSPASKLNSSVAKPVWGHGRQRSRVTSGLIAVLLLSAVALQIWSFALEKGAGTASAAAPQSLCSVLPNKIAGGAVRDEPIATTEEMKRAVGALLNYNDAIYRVYTVRQMEVKIYAAWWSRGRMSPRLIAAHTPDVCWVGAGWARDRLAEKDLKDVEEMMRKMKFGEGEFRVFTLKEKREHVVYWHKVDHRFITYANGQSPLWWAWIDELMRYGLRLKAEQLFVRVEANMPLKAIWACADYDQVREALLELGLRSEPVQMTDAFWARRN